MHAYKSLQPSPPLCDPIHHMPAKLLCPWDSLGKNTGVDCQALLQGTFLIQGSNPSFLCLLHWKAGSSPLAPPGKPCLIHSKYEIPNMLS